MRDLVKFVMCIILIAPCFMIFNENIQENWIVNIIGLLYLCGLACAVVSDTKRVDRWLDAFERFEKKYLNER